MIVCRSVVSPGRLGNPYDNSQAESLIKTLKAGDVCPMEYETFENLATGALQFTEACGERHLHSAIGYLSPAQFEHRNASTTVKTAA
jgi:putative transposase